jgi:hypothetical protein
MRNTQRKDKAVNDKMNVDQFLAIRKEAGLKIDPATAEVCWIYAQTLDPYGLGLDIPEEYQQIGREYFARSPGTDIWVLFRDLPDETEKALWARHERDLAFPAGIENHDGAKAERAVLAALKRLGVAI